MKLSDHRIAVFSLVAVIVFGVIASFLAYETAFPPRTKAITVTPSFLGTSSVILGPNGSVVAGKSTEINGIDGIIFTGYLTHIYLTVANTGNTPVFLRQVVLTTNSTSVGTQIEAVGSDAASISPEQSQTYIFALDSEGWALGIVKCTFTVTGDGVSASAVMVLEVAQYP
ncbi:MAG: hypothetical protein JRM74_02615 [Nitrososphaerota archaeon]|nr:hypothetical protein [Nitrososphaerota archaeon]